MLEFGLCRSQKRISPNFTYIKKGAIERGHTIYCSLTSRETGDDAVLFGEFGNCLRAAVPAAQGDDSGHARVQDQGPVHVVHVGQGELEHEFLVATENFQLIMRRITMQCIEVSGNDEKGHI